MIRKLRISLFCVLGATFAAQSNFTNFDALQNKQQQKKTLVLISQKSCGYCLLMSRYIGKSKEFYDLKVGYNFIDLDADSKHPIIFCGTQYLYRNFENGSGIHSLALHLANQNRILAYPTLVILDEDNKIITRIVGYLSKKELLELIGADLQNIE